MVSYKELGLVNSRELFKKPSKVNMPFLLLISTTWNSYRQLLQPV